MTQKRSNGDVIAAACEALTDDVERERLRTAHGGNWLLDIADAYAQRRKSEQHLEPRPTADEPDYAAVRRSAQTTANEMGLDVGIFRNNAYGKVTYLARILPRPENRYGQERNAEVVRPAPAQAVQP